MPTAYSYSRFSSPEQAKGRSKARQLEACVAYCKAHGLDLATDEDNTFLDEGLSAYKSEHVGEKGQLKRFLDRVADGSITPGSFLIIESLDRMGREVVGDAYSRLHELTRAGINVVTLTDGQVYRKGADLVQMITSIVVMARAHEESDTKSKRVGDAMRKKQEKARTHGTPMGRQVPMWLTVTAGGFEVNAERVAVVRRIFQMAIDGYGKAVIAKTLNVEGIPSFKGTAWGSSSVDKVINNRAVLGEYQPFTVQGVESGKRQPTGEAITNFYPAVVDAETFYAAHAAVDARRVAKSTKQSKNFNLWSGLAFCATCGKPLHMVNKGKPPKGGVYLHCSQARKGMCKAKAVRFDRSEIAFKEMLAKVDSLALVQDSSAKLGKELAAVEGRLAEQREKLRQFKADLKTRYTSVVSELVHEAEQEVKGLHAQLDSLNAALASEAITSKEDFFAKLDLVSYEGRARANALLKRLKVQVKVRRVDDACFYSVIRAGIPQVDISEKDGHAVSLPVNLEQMAKTKVQDLSNVSMLPDQHRQALGKLIDSLEEAVGVAAKD